MMEFESVRVVRECTIKGFGHREQGEASPSGWEWIHEIRRDFPKRGENLHPWQPRRRIE